jgi:hypothetical protein
VASPARADVVGPVEDERAQPVASQGGGGGQASRPGADDDDRLDRLGPLGVAVFVLRCRHEA